ncbi:MAG: hypothetical protein ABR961_13445 [Thermoanaerobaculaceae bacterium]
MVSPGAVLLAAVLTVPFGAPVSVRVGGDARLPAPGTIVGDFLVAAPSSPALDGGSIVVLRPLALGTLSVPLPGEPRPAVVEVRATLAPGAPAAPVLVPPAPVLPWQMPFALVLAVALAAGTVMVLRRQRRTDPLLELQQGLRPLSFESAWQNPQAADALARHCRAFLEHVTGSPCAAMTTRELSRLLAARLEAAVARPFGLALVLADEVRYARTAAPVDDAALLVREVLSAAPALASARGGAR